MKSFKFTESYHYTFIGVHAKKTVMVSVLQSHFCKSFYISDSNGQEGGRPTCHRQEWYYGTD